MNILKKIVAHKKKEILKMPDFPEKNLKKSDRDFFSALKNSQTFPKIIAEIKPKSPIAGAILPPDFSVKKMAKTFEKSDAAAISVLTDFDFFGGKFENLKMAKSATTKIPILCKDFIISKKQIRAARFFGADSFLLIAKILPREKLFELLKYGRKFKMEPLVEIADAADFAKIQNLGAKIIGINNRDLTTFSLDLFRTFLFAKKFQNGEIIASLSGFSGADARFVRGVADAILVGSSIGKSQKIAEFLRPKILKKLCGVRKFSDFERAKKIDANVFGLNFVENSRRKILEKVAKKIAEKKENSKFFGVFQNASPDFCAEKCRNFRLDFCQLHGDENPADFQNFPRPIVRAIKIFDEKTAISEILKWEKICDFFLFDGKNPGSGERFDFEIFKKIRKKIKKPFLIAGGISPENFLEIAEKSGADGVDVASGIEKNGKWDFEKIAKFFE